MLLIRICLFASLTAGVGLPGVANAGTTYHVAVDGLDAHPGTETQPFASIQHAVDEAGPGDVIRIGPGTFYERVTIKRSGAAGRPITLQGARGADGERLTHINGGEPVAPETWTPAPEIGPNVFKNESFAYEPKLVTVDGRFVAHAHRESHKTKAMEILAWPEDHRELVRPEQISIPVWKALGGVYAFDPDPEVHVTYLRLAEGIDPREHTLAISPGGAVVTIADASHIVLRGLAVGNGETGVLIEGKAAQHNLVDNCFITHGRRRVHITGGAAYNTVQNSHLTMGFIGAQTGAWAGGTDETAGIRFYLYNYFKYIASAATISDDKAIVIEGGARHNTIADNHLETGLIGIQTGDTTELMVRNNIIHGFSSVGTAIRNNSVDVHYDGNTIYDCSINIRLHTLNMGEGHRVYIYRNRLSLPDGLGTHVFCHFNGIIEDYPDADVTIYHNTLIGGKTGWAFPSDTGAYRGLPKFRWLNNIVATERPVHAKKPLNQNAAMVGLYDYNQVIGAGIVHGTPAWFGEHNFVALGEAAPFWHNEDRLNFRLPSDSPARHAGIDLSRPFTIQGQTYAPLPGMEPGYFSGERPDIGAIQHDSGNGRRETDR